MMETAAVKSTIDPDVLDQVDIRIGTIKEVRDLPDSDKLVVLVVDFGSFERTVVVGMKKEREDPTEITGLQALFVVNLEPRKIRGVMSEAMLFDIGYADGLTPVLAVPEKAIPNGARAG